MFIAHLPAGYLLSQSLRLVTNRAERIGLMAGSILPDFDLLLFYFRDAQSLHHHSYLTHRPLFWAVVFIAGASASRYHSARLLMALALGALLHLLLDTHIGMINWGWPFYDFRGPLVIVPASRSHWVLSFLTHWTFALELGLCGITVAIWHRAQKRKNPGL